MLENGRTSEAEKIYRDGLEVQAELAADASEEPRQRDLLAWTYRKLAETLKSAGRLDEAEAAYRQGIEVQEKLVTEYPNSMCR